MYHLNDSRCFITVHMQWRSKHHHTWENGLIMDSNFFRVSGTIAVSGFMSLQSYRGQL